MIAFSASDDKIIQTLNNIISYPYSTGPRRTDDTSKNEEFSIMDNFDEVTGENIREYNPHWLQIPDHPYRILIVGSSL